MGVVIGIWLLLCLSSAGCGWTFDVPHESPITPACAKYFIIKVGASTMILLRCHAVRPATPRSMYDIVVYLGVLKNAFTIGE